MAVVKNLKLYNSSIDATIVDELVIKENVTPIKTIIKTKKWASSVFDDFQETAVEKSPIVEEIFAIDVEEPKIEEIEAVAEEPIIVEEPTLDESMAIIELPDEVKEEPMDVVDEEPKLEETVEREEYFKPQRRSYKKSKK